MTNDGSAARGLTLAFGPFRLDTAQGTLLRDGQPVRLSSRPREILLVLVERAGELVKKRELISRVWPGICVEESVLRVHISVLRKILGDGTPGIRYVENITGLGYRFIAPVRAVADVPPGHATDAEANQQLSDLSLPPMPRI